MLLEILQDAYFAAIAAIGFAAISRPPRRAYLYCALIAAVGHSTRFVLMAPTLGDTNIIVASFVASLLIGVIAVFISPIAHMPAETCFFPALLPMIPGMYAYRCFGGLAMCLLSKGEEMFNHYFYLFMSNGVTCGTIILGMVVGASLPVFIFKKVSFQATREHEN